MASTVIGKQDIVNFRTQGYFVLNDVLPAAHLELLRAECDTAIADVHADMDRLGVRVLGGNRRGLQYTPGNCRLTQPDLRDFLFGDMMVPICEALLGPESYLIWEQYSVKSGTKTDTADATFDSDGAPQSLGRFSWHQDSGYVPRDHTPYLSCWIALDDITPDNGPLSVIPFPDLGITTRVAHLPDPDNGDLVGYFGSLTGTVLTPTAGSIVCFSSTLFHSSGRNSTIAPRRAFLAQYSPARLAADGTLLWESAEQVRTAAAAASGHGA